MGLLGVLLFVLKVIWASRYFGIQLLMWARAVRAKGWKDLKVEAGEEKKTQSERGACSQVWRAAPCGGCWAVPLHFLQHGIVVARSEDGGYFP